MGPEVDFNQFEVLSFDCYGTLIDWERGIIDAVKPVLQSHRISINVETLLNRYAEVESRIEAGTYLAYRQVLQMIMDGFAEKYDFKLREGERDVIANSIGKWPAFPDTVNALQRLKEQFKLAIISNVDADLFDLTLRHLRVAFDWVVTASEVGAYKPDRKMFTEAMKTFDVPKERWLHVAQSLYHDIVPANDLGITTVWINRRKNSPGSGATPPAKVNPDMEFETLEGLAHAAATHEQV